MKSETRSEIRDQIIFIICFIAAWYVVYKMRVFSPTAFPSVGDIGESFVTAFTTNDMLSYTGHSLLLIAKGLAIGNLVGIGLCLLQRYAGVVKLDPETYYVETVPVEINIPLIILLNIATLLISVIVLIAPSYLISHIQPAKSMKYE